MPLSPLLSQADWDAQYLLALSYLNFDMPLSLVMLPGSLENCTWTDKQWQSLALYELDACYHLGSPPPISSKPINWQQFHNLISPDKAPVLHIHQWLDVSSFDTWHPLVSAEDKLLLFGYIDKTSLTKVMNTWPNANVYVVKTDSQPHIGMKSNLIDHQRWSKLLQQNPVTLTWN